MLASETLWSSFVNVNLKNLSRPVLDVYVSLFFFLKKQYFIVTCMVCGLVTLFKKKSLLSPSHGLFGFAWGGSFLE